MPSTVPRREDLCRKFHCAVKSRTEDVQRYLAFPLMCKSWDCPDCRKKKADDYKHRMRRLFDGRGLWFYTLTYFHSMSPPEAWGTYNAAWNRLRTNLSNRYGSFNYVRVLESHTNSPYPHLHIIADMRFRETDFGPAAIAAGFGFQIKIKKITSELCAAYIIKYLTKEWKNEESWTLRKKYRCRLISFSRGLLSPLPDGGNWETLLRGSDLQDCINHIRMDYEWNTKQHGTAKDERFRDDFYEVTIVWTDRDPLLLQRPVDDWEPDDWVPK